MWKHNLESADAAYDSRSVEHEQKGITANGGCLIAFEI